MYIPSQFLAEYVFIGELDTFQVLLEGLGDRLTDLGLDGDAMEALT